MSGVSTAHITFEKEWLGSYASLGWDRGWGDVVVPGLRAHFQHISDDHESPLEMIIIGAAGYWRDDTVSGGWNGGPIAAFSSNPASWVRLSEYYASPIRLADETVNGIQCYHLQFTVNLPPGWTISGGGTGEAWIAKADYSLVKAIYDLQYQGYRESGHFRLTLELSDLNKPVSIVPPK
jgi:hypothetical protein